jgi:hypothetical protein
MLVKTYAAAVHGVDAQVITIEINTGGAVYINSERVAFSKRNIPSSTDKNSNRSALDSKSLIFISIF